MDLKHKRYAKNGSKKNYQKRLNRKKLRVKT